MTRYWVDPRDTLPADGQDVILAMPVGIDTIVSVIGVRHEHAWFIENSANWPDAGAQYVGVHDDEVAAWRALPGSATLTVECEKEGDANE